jgi:nitroreductase
MNYFDLVRSRFSVRDFKDEPLSLEHLSAIVEAGRVAPSACNKQPQKVYIVKSKEARAALAKVCRFTFGAPVILAVGYDRDREWKNRLMGGHGSGECDASIVTTQMMLAAWELGVGSCWVGYFNADEVREALSLPEGVCITALLPLGYPKEGAKPLDLHYEYRPYEETVETL